MHSSAVVASTSGAPISGGQAAGVAGDGVAPEDVGFAALFAAQIQGDPGVLLIPVMADVAVDTLSLVDSKQQDLPPEVAVDPTLAGMLLAQMAPPPAEAAPQDVVLQVSAESDVADVAVLSGMQQIPVEAKGEIASWFSPQSAKSTVEGRAIVPSTRVGSDADLELAERPLLGVGQEKVEEFAASGKVLPLNSGVDIKNNETRMTHLVAAENQHLSESVLPASAMTVNQTVLATEFKATAATVQAPIGSAGWGDAVGQKVVWMASQQQQVAELHLNPPHLGPMEVRLTINNDQVTALFVSHQPVVREAIEAAMPRLREMFADNGMMLGNATVSSDSLPQQQASGQDDKNPGSSRRLDYQAVNSSMSGSIGGVLPLRSDGRGLVDLFA
jgi:flagellar hook-length control protein FliK